MPCKNASKAHVIMVENRDTSHFMNLDQIRNRLDQFAAVRNRDQFHTPKNLSMALAAEAAELLEIIFNIPRSETKKRECAISAINWASCRLTTERDESADYTRAHKLLIQTAYDRLLTGAFIWLYNVYTLD